MNFFRRLWPIRVQNTYNEALDDVNKMTLHGTSLFDQSILKIVIHILITVFFFVFKDTYWFVEDYFSVFKRIHSPHADSVLGLSSFLNYTFMNPKWHLLLYYILRYLKLITQLLWADSISRIFHLILIKVSYHNGLDRKTFEGKISIVKRKSEIYKPQVIMEEYLSHSFNCWESCGILVKDRFILWGNIEWGCIFIVDRPITFWNSQTVDLVKLNRSSLVVSFLIMHIFIIFLWVFHIFNDDIANLESRLPKSHF